MSQADLRALAPDPVLRPDGLPALDDWSLDPAVRHLNHGSFGAVPSATGAWQQALREEAERDPVAWFRHLPARVAQARCAIADWLHAPQEATALVPNASAGVTAVLSSLPLRAGERIVVTDHARGADPQPSDDHVGPVPGLDGRRSGHLFPLGPPQQPLRHHRKAVDIRLGRGTQSRPVGPRVSPVTRRRPNDPRSVPVDGTVTPVRA